MIFPFLDPNDPKVTKKYRSDLLLPTYYEDNDGDDRAKHGSWRSLKQKTQETASNINNSLLAITRPGYSNPRGYRAKLASSETLETFEKYSYYDDDGRLSNVSTEVNDDGYFNRLRWKDNEPNDNDLSVSRLSLPSLLQKPEDDVRRSFRGNSLDAIYENANAKTELSAIMPKDEKFYDISITVPNNKVQRKKRHLTQNGNLKRNLVFRSSNYLRDMRLHRHSINYRGAMLNTHRYRMKASSCPNIYRNSMTTLARDNEEVCFCRGTIFFNFTYMHIFLPFWIEMVR